MTTPFYRNVHFRRCHATLALLWLVVVLVLATNLALRAQKGPMFESDLLSLLPAAQADAGVQRAVDTVSARLRQKVMFIVRTAPTADAVDAAESVQQQLSQSGLFSALQFRISSADQSALAAAYFPHRHGLLADADRARLLDAPSLQPITQRAFRDLLNPLLPLNADLLQADPLQLFMHYINSLAHNDSLLKLQDGVLQYRDDRQHAVQIVATLGEGAFDIANHDNYRQLLQQIRAGLAHDFNGAELLTSGIINYAAVASDSARNEVSLIGIGSMLGITLLMLLTFRSLRPLWLSLLIIGVGLTVALAMSMLLFERVHVMTLVFGASLIGVLDYSLHFLVENRLVENRLVESGDAAHNDGWRCLHLVWPGLALSMVTNVAAYLAMLFAPFPGLRQVAVFSALGLSAACLSVLLWFPYLVSARAAKKPLRSWRLAHWWLDCWDRAPRATLYLLMAVGVLLAFRIVQSPADDDIKRLQHVPPQLVAQEQAVKTLAGISNGSQFFLVRGDSLQQLLEREEALRDRLDTLVGKGALAGYQALSKALPSLARQQDNHRLLLKAVEADPLSLSSYADHAGFDDALLRDYKAQLQATPEWLPATALLQNPAFAWRHLLLDPGSDGGANSAVASVVLLSGIRDLSALSAPTKTLEGVTLVDHAGSVSSLLGQYRERAMQLAVIAYMLALLGLSWRYGWRTVLLVLCPPAVSALLALTISSALALPINLFNSLAVLVIMGVGIDYTLFFAENRSTRDATMMAVILACLSTELSFGLLALSETPVVRSFGLTMCIGIACALLLAPLAGARAFAIGGTAARVATNQQ